MKRISLAVLLGAASVLALAPLLACDDDTTVNTAFKDAGAGEGGEAGSGGKSEAGSGNEAGTANDAGKPDADASDDGG